VSFDPSLLLPIARALPVDLTLDKEARTRSSIGRSYYSAFLATRKAICVALGTHVDNDIGHGELTNQLYSASSASGNSDLSATAKVLQDLYDARKAADYSLEPSPKWLANLQKPDFAKRLAAQASGVISKLPGIDFSAMAGRL
jgi:hypothetical protein